MISCVGRFMLLKSLVLRPALVVFFFACFCSASSLVHAEITVSYSCGDVESYKLEPSVQRQLAASISQGYDPCRTFEPPKGKSSSHCLQCNPQNCVNISDGDDGEKCKNLLLNGVVSALTPDKGVIGGSGTTPAMGGVPQGEMPGTAPVDWSPGGSPLGPPDNTGNNPGESPGGEVPSPEQCEQMAPLIATICSPHCKYFPTNSSQSTKEGYCCIKVITNNYYAQFGSYVGPGSACICSPSPKTCVHGDGKISGNPAAIPEGEVIAQVCSPSLTSNARECISISTHDGLSPITTRLPGYEAASRSGIESIMALVTMIKNRGVLAANAVLDTADVYKNWTDINGTVMPKVYYPNGNPPGSTPDRTSFFEHTDWRITGPNCKDPISDQCVDAPSCFNNPKAACKLASVFRPNPLSEAGQGAGRFIPCSLENPISTQDPTQARDTGYSQDFVADFLYYYTNLFTTANSYHSVLNPQYLLQLSSTPPIGWPFSNTLNMTPKTTQAGGAVSRMLFSWPKYSEAWPRLGWEIDVDAGESRIFTVKQVEEMLACEPDRTDYPIPSVAVVVSDKYFRGHTGIVYDYDAGNKRATIMTTNWLYNPSCNPQGSGRELQFDYHNCYQINNSFGYARMVSGIPLTNAAINPAAPASRTTFIVDFNDRVPFYIGQ